MSKTHTTNACNTRLHSCTPYMHALNQTATLRLHARHVVMHHIRIVNISACAIYPYAHYTGSYSHPHAPAYMPKVCITCRPNDSLQYIERYNFNQQLRMLKKMNSGLARARVPYITTGSNPWWQMVLVFAPHNFSQEGKNLFVKRKSNDWYPEYPEFEKWGALRFFLWEPNAKIRNPHQGLDESEIWCAGRLWEKKSRWQSWGSKNAGKTLSAPRKDNLEIPVTELSIIL